VRILDLFCGAGGCSMGYSRAFPDAAIVGVDINPQPRYPFSFVQADAMTYPLDGFDFIHASPPCQAYTTMRVMPNAGVHPELVGPTRVRLQATGLPWVMENVPGAPLNAGPPSLFTDESGVVLCGTMFGLNDGTFELRRHRLFESNVPLVQLACRHRLPVIGFYGDHARTRQRTVNGNRDRGGDITGIARKMPLVRDLLGIDWMTWHEATQAIPPAYTEFIGHALAAHLMERAA
jgi:DNA (cytosine-5)-methyltransferase 1